MRILGHDAAPPRDALEIPNTADVNTVAGGLATAPAVVLEFPAWTDGRAYSQAVVLRARLRYTGEIRARGEVLHDMLPLLRRCGFDAVQLAAGQDLAEAARVVAQLPAPFPGHYQSDTRRPPPGGGAR